MSTASLPDFEHTLALAKGNLEAPDLAECHGVVCGLLCRQADAGFDLYIRCLETLGLVVDTGTALGLSLEELLNTTRAQLADEEMGLCLWLPDDDEMLEERTMALSQWCGGFLAGLGSGADGKVNILSEESREALSDLQEISSADVTDSSQSEEDEIAFAEIVEYIRIVILMVREELRHPDEQDVIH